MLRSALASLIAAGTLVGCAGSSNSGPATGTNAFLAPNRATGGLASAPIETPVKLDFPQKVEHVIARAGPVYIAGQPSEEAMRALVADGVTVVINLRTQPEMDNREQVPYDEVALLKELKVDYVHIPIGGRDHPPTPDAVDQVAAALASHNGKALLHCTVAWRASNMWAAYLIRHRGVDPEKALADAGKVNLDRPQYAQLLGADVTLVPRKATAN